MSGELSITVADDEASRRRVADFLSRTIRSDPRYISHGEIQCGLSPDGKRWHEDLGTRMREQLAGPSDDKTIIMGHRPNGELVAAAILLHVENNGIRHLVIEDLSVDPSQRSHGVGAKMMTFIEDHARREKMDWVFLESGRENHRAHAFFEQHGFNEVSHVFAKRLM